MWDKDDDVTLPSDLIASNEQNSLFRFKSDNKQAAWTCYEKHPAYSELIKSPTFTTRFSALLGFMKFYSIVVVKRIISYEAIPAHLRKPKSISGFILFVRSAFAQMLKKITPKHPILINGKAKDQCNTLNDQGIFVVKINDSSLKKIDELVTPVLEKLRQKRATHQGGERDFSDSRATAMRPEHEELFHAIEATFNQHF